MKTLQQFKKTLLAVLLLSVSMGFVACSSDDDDEDTKSPTLYGMVGVYSGEYVVQTPLDGEEITPEGIKMEVTNDKLKFASYPILPALKAVITDEEVLNQVLEDIQEQITPTVLNYEVKKSNDKEKTINFEVDFDDLEMSLSDGSILKIDIDDENQGVFTGSDSTGTINLPLEVEVELLAKDKKQLLKKAEVKYKFTFQKITK